MAYGSSKVGAYEPIKRKTKKAETKNNGGIIGAAGYLAGSAAAGVAGVAEGIIDLGVAFGADITGNHDYAEYVFKDNVVGDWHESITEDYNPDDVIKFGGDVLHGLGQSSWFLLSLIPGAQWLGPAVFGAGMVGQGISSAAEQTGDVGLKEVAYGATTAALETGLEVALGGMGKVAKAGVGAIAKKTGKSTFQKIASSAARKGLAKKIFSDAAGEFAEEFISEYADTFLQKLYQVNPNAEYSLTNALYAGAVGAVSGGVSAGSVDVISTTARQQIGAKLIKDGNAQTTVNTATHVADKLAASGTNFKHAAEWVRTLRGEVDAYNKLSPEAQKGLRGQTILGEMKASLYFAESQAFHGGIVEKIKNESEENRAALAEYINRSIDKSKRKRDYTAADIAADTDEIATQLGIMNMAGTAFFNFEGAMADMAMERGIESVIEKERASGVKSAQSEAPTAQAAPVDEAFAAAVARTEPEKKTAPETTSPTRRETRSEGGVPVAGETNFVQNAEVSAPNRAAPIENIYEDGAESLPYSGVPEATPGTYPTVEELDIEGRETKYDLTEDGREVMPDSGKPEPPGSAYPSVQKQELEGMTVTDAERAEARARTEKAAKFEQEAQEATEGTETQRSAENVAEAKESGKAAEKSSESKNESTESKKTEDQSGSPKISEAKESLTDEQRAERAKKQADKWIEWEKKTAPTAKELNTAREYVKGFDSLNNRRRLAIIRMIRSSEGVDAQTVKGIANVMAVIPESDLEVRFANGIGNKGLITKIGNKSVIVIDSSTDRKTTIKGTIAHELTHYLENKAGYSTFAKYVRDHAKPETIEKHKNRYINGWAKIGHKYTEAELDSEITASLVADALNNERFLKRYADRDKKLIQKAFEWLKGLATRSKKKGKETEEISEITDEMALNLIDLLQSDKTTGESKSGTRYSFSSIAYTFFGEEDMAVGEFTERDYKKTEGYKSYIEECLNNFRQSRGDSFNEAAARKEIEDGIAGIVRVAVAAKSAGYDIYDSAGQRTTRDSKQRLLFSSLEPNSDYFTSSDISTICDKRKNFTEIEAEINRIEAEKGVPREKRFFSDINNFFILHDILAKHGLTTACRQCYVESMRKNLGRMANAFIDLVTETDESNKKNKQLYNNKGEKKSGNAELRRRVRELMADEGLSDSFFTFEMLTDGENLSELRLQHPLLFEAYNSFYGQSKPKMPKSATPFRFGELTALLTDHNGKINQGLLKRINSTGGFRLQSYSDFQIKNYVDVLQVIFEAGTLGLNGHAYTKVPAFLDATEGTNLKRNISIFMYRDGDEWKIDRNDSFPWALDKIYDVVNADKSGDTGIIAVSQNEDMSAWIMANDNVGYGIPFHKSGTKMAVVRETVVKTPQGDVKGYLGIKDHTKYQSEVYASGESKGKKVKAPINIYEFWDFNNTRMSRNNLIEKNVKKYIDECERLGYLPKFRDYVMNNEKVLNATLAYAKKLGYADANATVEDISFKYKGYTIPYGYYKFLVDFGVFTPEGKASPVKALSLKDYNFDKAVSFFSDSKKLRINELLQQIANGEERDKYRKLMDEGKMTIAELGKVIKDKRDAVVAEVVGETKYDLADEDADGNAEKKVDETLNEHGEVKDKYFAAAVARAQQGKAPDPEPAEKRAERMIETRKEKFSKLLRQAATIQRKIEKLNKTADKKSNAAHVKKLKQEYREIMMRLEDLQRELREMGYDLNAENRLIERQKKQIETQGEEIADLKQQKRELEELEREDRIMRDLAKRESSRIARLYAQQRAEFGNVYNEAEIKRAINDMLERGLISQFFGGQYMPDLSTKQKNGIAEYIAMQLNILGTAEGKQAQNIIHTVANDMIKRMTFTEADTDETLYLDKIVDDDTAKQFTDMIEGDLIGIFQNIGTLNPFSKLQKEFEIVRQKYLDKEKQSKERQEFGKELPKTYQAALKIKKLAAHGKGSFSEAVQLVADELGKMVDESGHLHFGRIDAAMGEVARFFEGEAMKADSERSQLKDEAKIADEGVVWSVNPALQEQVEKYLRLRKGREGQALTAEELKLVGEVLRGMKTTIERYNKEFINGHWVDVETIASNTAEDLLSFVAKDKEYKTKIGAFLGGKVGKNVDQFYFYYILSPETVIEALEGYKQGGLLKSLYHSVRVAKQKAEHRAVQMKKPFAEFLDDKENRWEAQKDQGGREGKSYSYRDKLNVRTINVNGTNITLGEAIYLLMLTKREHAWAGLQNEGFITYDENNKQRERVRVDDIPRVRDLIANQLDKTDIKFLEMAEEFFNKTATKVKEDADMEIFGFTNTQAGYYVPIIRDRYSRMGGVTDARQSIGSIITVYNKSFNQNLVENAKALEGKNIMSIINDHANGLADYAELYLPLKAFDRVYNKVVSTSDGNKSIREILNTKVWNGTELYFKDLFSDIQGHGRKQDHVIDKIVGKARSAWVNSVLGANLKVVATQTTSLGAATQVIEPKYIMPAISVIPQFKGDKIAALRERAYKYSDVIEPRSFDMGAIKAQGNVDKINKIGEKSGFLIGVMDEQICLTIFHAAELKVQDTKGYAIGTEDNARLAAKIADEAIYTTQAMTAASERSAMQRSTSEIARLFSMFTSDSVKNLSHLYGNVMKYIAHSQRVKAGDTSYQAALETDKKEIGRSMRTLAITGVMLGLITQAFKYLFAKEEEEPEDKAWDFAIDIASSTLNILPIVSDMVDKFVFNYDMSMNVLDVLNDSIESLSKGFKTMGKQMSGEYVSTGEAVGVAVDVIKSGASMIGFPIAPAERTITGLMRRFVPSAIYGYDAMFSNPSYTADLKDAVENGDEALAEHVLSQLYKNEVNGTYTSDELEEVARLYKAGNTSVIPQKIGAEINGVKLTSAQRKQFTKIYSKASGEVNKLISGSYYSSLNDEQRAKAIKNIYAMFYNRAANEITGKEMTTATAYSYLTSNYSALFASQAYKSGIDEQKDASGNKITVKDQFVDYAANLGLSAEDLLVISYANGVRDKATRAAFLQYLNSLSLTAEIKTQIAERLGFELKDGVIVEKTEQ